MIDHEHNEQKKLIDWSDRWFRVKFKHLTCNTVNTKGKKRINSPLVAFPNEGKRSKITGSRMKQRGLRAGIPDLVLLVKNEKYIGMFIEMKYGKNKTTQNQKVWLSLLSTIGYKCVVCYSFEEAKTAIENYMRNYEQN